ncbi:MAG: hypothetical protein IKI15_04635 [Lachnospiraceae bacterium]|nr:hypothetical protein [Lachnospiraceae bacterium]
MWIAYHDAYADAAQTKKAMLHVENTGSRVLLIAGHEDEVWPAEYSVRETEKNLIKAGYEKYVKVIVYPHGSHLNGLMPDRTLSW